MGAELTARPAGGRRVRGSDEVAGIVSVRSRRPGPPGRGAGRGGPSCYVRAVRIIRILFVAVAVLAVIARYLRERRRIGIVERLSGREGLAYLERTRSGGDRFDLIVTIVLAAGACASLVALAAAVA